jgi:hypothetical protein
MMRLRVLAASLTALVAVASAEAQTIRGVVVDDSTKLPVEGASVMLLDASSSEIARSTRSDSAGNFTLHAARPGSYRLRAVRIGYQPLTSETVKLGIGQLTVMRLRMTTLAQRLIPVRITERRSLTAAELMSSTGFDLRESKGLGMFLSGSRLAALGHYGLQEIIASLLQPTLYVRADPVLGEVIRMRQGTSECAPEIFLDGQLLATAPDPIIRFDSSGLETALDTLRRTLRAEAEDQRVASSQGYALSVLANLRAIDLHGIEVYRANQVLPASLGGWFGATKKSMRPCGTLAVWTKSGVGLPITSAKSRRVDALQVISGSVVGYETGLPVANVPVTLLNDGRDVIGKPVVSDARGRFTIRTNRIGPLRLHTGSVGYTESTTPAIDVGTDELVLVKVFVSAFQPVMTPLGVAGRITPQRLSVTSRAGFTYRRERAIRGTFFGVEDIGAANPARIIDLLKPLSGVRIGDSGEAGSITFPRADDLPRCKPSFHLDGRPVVGAIDTALAAVPMERILGVEVYLAPEDVPPIFGDFAAECGLIAIWRKP